MNARLVVLVSGAGTNLQALLDACADPGYGATRRRGRRRPRLHRRTRPGESGRYSDIHRESAAISPRRDDWDQALAAACEQHRPDLIVCAGFMKLVGQAFLARFDGRCLNTHPALLPSFPGMHGVRDALGYGVKVSGCTVFLVDEGVDAGPVLAQAAVPVHDDDDEASLHERIKVAERALLVDTVGRMAREGWSVNGDRKVRIGT